MARRTEIVALRLTPTERKRLDTLSAATGRTKSAVLRSLLKREAAQEDKQHKGRDYM